MEFYGSLAGAAAVWGRGWVGGGHKGQFVVPLGLENSAIKSQERRSSLGLVLTKMYIQANDSLGGYRR
jgi:hypothetical protein